MLILDVHELGHVTVQFGIFLCMWCLKRISFRIGFREKIVCLRLMGL